MAIHKILRNDLVFYDSLDNETHAVKQIARSLSGDMPGDTFTCVDEKGEPYYEVITRLRTKYQVKNGPLFLGGEQEEKNPKE